MRAIYRVENPLFAGAMRVSNEAAFPVFALAAPVSGGIALARGESLRPALRLGVSEVGTTVVVLALKNVLRRPRPYRAMDEITARDRRYTGESVVDPHSFPSGHAALSFAVATSVTLSDARLAAPAYVWATTTSVARIWHGVHYPSDVLVGAAIGAGAAGLVHVLAAVRRATIGRRRSVSCRGPALTGADLAASRFRPLVLDLSAAHPDVLVLVGTQTGNSEIVADAIAETLGELGFAAHVLDMAEAIPDDLADYRQLVAVTCTWSGGTYPDNAVDYTEALDGLAPDLSGLAFGVVGLGDRDYDPFYQTASRRLDARLAELGATRAAATHEIDGGPTPAQIEDACAWATGLAEAFSASLS